MSRRRRVDKPKQPEPIHFRWLPAAAIFLIALLVYVPSWRGEFLWDDANLIVNSEIVKDANGWWKAWIAPPRSHPDYFPLTTNTIWLEWRFFGESPVGYRVVNSLLHALAAVALYLLLKQLRLPGAAWAAVLFAVHPVNVESVAWISERKNTLSMLFGILTFFWLARWHMNRTQGSYGAALIFFFAAVASKASVVALPLVFLAYLWWKDRKVESRDLRAIVPFVVVSVFFGLMVIYFQHSRAALGEWDVEMPGWLGRLAGAGWAYWHYVWTTFWPFNLITVYPWPEIDPPSLWQIAVALGTALAGAGLFLAKNTVLRTVGFGMVATALLLAPVLGFVKMSFMRYSLVSDHLQQLIVPLLTAVVVCGLATWARKKNIPKAAIALPLVVTMAFTFVSLQRALLHTSNEALWKDTLAKNADCAVAHNFVGSTLAARGQLEKAAKHFLEATRLAPRDAEARTNLAFSLVDRGRSDEAIPVFREVIDSGSDYPGAFLGLAQIYASRGQTSSAVDVLKDGASRFPKRMTLSAAAAGSLVTEERYAEAIPFLEQCLVLDPNNPQLHSDLAEVRAKAASKLLGP